MTAAMRKSISVVVLFAICLSSSAALWATTGGGTGHPMPRDSKESPSPSQPGE